MKNSWTMMTGKHIGKAAFALAAFLGLSASPAVAYPGLPSRREDVPQDRRQHHRDQTRSESAQPRGDSDGEIEEQEGIDAGGWKDFVLQQGRRQNDQRTGGVGDSPRNGGRPQGQHSSDSILSRAVLTHVPTSCSTESLWPSPCHTIPHQRPQRGCNFRSWVVDLACEPVGRAKRLVVASIDRRFACDGIRAG